ncbi:hypothetical protein J2T02_002860 [Chitinophaga terrae (ex Kim and Jung 2007)]|uniref:hypothetical protein n=1 Tax=Chitinophaga terrae (ex Kim and Jung 2007) TaxID=408074 RepID=UPI0027811FF2|nr:hypothetical protein [Chitinophaga terrae (ex Kim and Jung 2007)]MDQ0107739.1 hypothetical protein [Chitinophaga terrae (ex Kim and Jung 2007)]
MKEKFEAWLRRDIYKPGEEAMNLNAEAARKLQNSVMTTALELPGRFKKFI